MNLLENELILSCVELRNGCYGDALHRLIETERICSENVLVQNNLAVAKCVKKDLEGEGSNLNVQNLKTQEILASFQHMILSNPMNYIGYYNLFNFHIKNTNYKQALKSLIQSIYALYLSKALNLNEQKMLKLVPKQYCAHSVIFHIVKTIICLKNQKYIIAINQLNRVVENSLLIKDKIIILSFIKLIFQALQEKEKKQQIELKIQQLEKLIDSNQNEWTDSQSYFRIKCEVLMSESQTDLTLQISKRLKQFAALLKEIQIRKMKRSSKTNQLIFKQVNPSQLRQLPINKQSLFEELKSSILESPLYTKSESKKLSRSRNSQQNSMNSSQQYVLNPVNKQRMFLTNRSQFAQRQKLVSSLPQSIELINTLLHKTKDETNKKRLSSSFSMSGFAGGKKIQNNQT